MNLLPETVQVGDTTYYLNKGEIINVQGRQYSAHMARVNYRVGQHDVAMMEKALVDRGANGALVPAYYQIMYILTKS